MSRFVFFIYEFKKLTALEVGILLVDNLSKYESNTKLKSPPIIRFEVEKSAIKLKNVPNKLWVIPVRPIYVK